MTGARGRAPAADSAVRSAAARDVQAIAAVHSRAWRQSYAGALPSPLLAALDPQALAGAWEAAVRRPPTTGHRVLVATERDIVAGFAAVAPGTDPDSAGGDVEVVALEVDPAHRGAGHGSRLLNAAVETARDMGALRVLVWVPEIDTARADFLAAAGVVADGATRVRADDDGTAWPECRVSALLTGEPSS